MRRIVVGAGQRKVNDMEHPKNDLISREVVLKKVEELKEGPVNYGTLLGFAIWLRELPCEYDVHSVTEWLEARKKMYDEKLNKVMNGEIKDVGFWEDVKAYSDSIDIVESGWKDSKKETKSD